MESFTSQILQFGFNWAPMDFALCQGQIVSTGQNPALFSLVGTAFGGNGQSTYGYPDLRGRTPIGVGTLPIQNQPVLRGSLGGYEDVTLTVAEMPGHSHMLQGTTEAADRLPFNGNILAAGNVTSYGSATSLTTLSTSSLPTTAGGNSPHNNLQPSLVINFCICLDGYYPPRS